MRFLYWPFTACVLRARSGTSALLRETYDHLTYAMEPLDLYIHLRLDGAIRFA